MKAIGAIDLGACDGYTVDRPAGCTGIAEQILATPGGDGLKLCAVCVAEMRGERGAGATLRSIAASLYDEDRTVGDWLKLYRGTLAHDGTGYVLRDGKRKVIAKGATIGEICDVIDRQHNRSAALSFKLPDQFLRAFREQRRKGERIEHFLRDAFLAEICRRAA